jgi:hypothetical protein
MSVDGLSSAVDHFVAASIHCVDADLERHWEWQSYDEGVRFAFFRTYEELRQLAARLSILRTKSLHLQSTAQCSLGQYHAAYRDLQAVLLGLSPDQMAQVPAPGEWSIVRILPHVIQTSRSFFANILFALERGRLGLKSPVRMTEADWEKFWLGDTFDQVVKAADLQATLDYFDRFHQRILRDLSGIEDRELEIESWWWEDEPYSIEFRLHRFDSHLRQHTVQVEKTLAMLGLAPNEAKRLLRLIYNALAEVESAQIGAWDFGDEQCQKLALDVMARAEGISRLIHS